MKKRVLMVNAAAMVALLATLVWTLVDAGAVTRQPWTVTCYGCKGCTASCVLGIDPQGFVSAALAGDPELYIYATNVRLQAERAVELDPEMVVTAGGRRCTAREALAELGPEAEVTSYRMRAREAARFCLLCGACEKQCVLDLPLLRTIQQLRVEQGLERNRSAE